MVELRLAGAANVDEANAVLKEFIPRYNERFAVPPVEAEPAFRPVLPHLRLEHIFCCKEQRILNPGYTIHYGGQNYRLVSERGAPAIPLRSIVDVLEHPGSIYVAYKGQIYPTQTQPLPEAELFRKNKAAQVSSSKLQTTSGPKSSYKPGPNHRGVNGHLNKRLLAIPRKRQ